MGHFWAQNQHLNFSINLFSSFFLKLYLLTGIKEWFKVNVLDFEGKCILCSKWGKWAKC